MIHRRLGLLISLLLFGCAHTGVETAGPVAIAPDIAVTLPQDVGLPQSIEASQLVVATYGSQKFVFEVHINGNADHANIAGFDMAGRHSISITWTQDSITYETAPWVPAEMAPQYILADMVLIYWPQPIADETLHGTGILHAARNSRTVTKNGSKIVAIKYQPDKKGDIWNGRVRYQNLARGYTLDIQSARETP